MATTHSITDAAGVDYLAITDASQTALDIAGSMSGLVWIRPSAISRIHTLFSKWDQAGAQRAYRFFVNASNQMEFGYSNDGIANNTAVSGAITGWAINTWFSLGFVFISGTPEVQFYLNGVAFGSAAALAGPGTVFNGTADFRVGNFHDGVAGDNFRGHIDQVKIYNDERTAGEIQNEYQEAPIVGSNLQAGYGLDNVLTDISGNANTLVNNGTSFVEGEVHGYEGHDSAKGLIDGSGAGGAFNYFAASVTGEVGSGGGGGSLTYRMRGNDTTLASIVYWGSTTVDSAASDYGGPGPVTDIVVHKVLGA
jgi:hypothetical protein